MHISKSLPTLADICFSVKVRPARLSSAVAHVRQTCHPSGDEYQHREV